MKQRQVPWGRAFQQIQVNPAPTSPYPIAQQDIEILDVRDFASLEKLLRDVRLAGDKTVKVYEHVQMQPKKYKLSSLQPTALYVLQTQLTQAATMLQYLSTQHSQNLCGLTGIMDYKQAGELYRMAPPIIEKYIEPTTGQEVAVIIDGLHRLYLARQLGFEEAWVIEISDVPASLPPTPLPVAWDEIVVYGEVPPADKKRRYRYTSPKAYPDMTAVTSVPITQDNYLYFLYRDFSVLGSSGIRTPK